MKLAAVTVWFNPASLKNQNAIANIMSYADFCDVVIIVDNSKNDNSNLIPIKSSYIYLSNKNNGGIAGALNLGILTAQSKGCDFVLTMDQDSWFSNGKANMYIQNVEKHLNVAKVFSLKLEYNDSKSGALLKWPTEYIPKSLKRFIKHSLLRKKIPQKKEIQEHEYVTQAYTSGTISEIKLWEAIGKYDEFLFIDEVDFDFCNKVLLHNEKILKFNNCTMNHSLGTKYRTLFPKCYYTKNKKRFYYIIRNKYIQEFRYGKLLNNHNYKRERWEFFRDYCILNSKNILYFAIYLKAKRDAFKYIKLKQS